MSLPPSIQTFIEGRIDFEGQKTVDVISRYALAVLTFISFVAGFALQSLQVTFTTLSGGTLLLFLVVLPQWPFYNRNPVQWLPALSSTSETEKKKTR